jgi:hypothetical protein
MSDTETLDQLKTIMKVDSNEELVAKATEMATQIVLVAVKDNRLAFAQFNVAVAQQIIATLEEGIANAPLRFE